VPKITRAADSSVGAAADAAVVQIADMLPSPLTSPLLSRAPLLPVAATSVVFPPLKAIIIGDWGIGYDSQAGHNQPLVAQQLAATANVFKPHVILSPGDQIYHLGVSSADDPQLHEKFEDVYTASALQM
jgi:hypothetical protein